MQTDRVQRRRRELASETYIRLGFDNKKKKTEGLGLDVYLY